MRSDFFLPFILLIDRGAIVNVWSVFVRHTLFALLIFQQAFIRFVCESQMFEKDFRKCEKLITYDGTAIQSLVIMKIVAKAILSSFCRKTVSHIGHARRHGRPYEMTEMQPWRK